MDANAVRRLLSQAVSKTSVTGWAETHGVDRVHVHQVLSGRREPGDKILEPLGLIRVVSYQRERSTR